MSHSIEDEQNTLYSNTLQHFDFNESLNKQIKLSFLD